MGKRLFRIFLTACMVLSLLPGYTQPVMAAYSPTIYMTLDGQPISPSAIEAHYVFLSAHNDSYSKFFDFTEGPTGTFTRSNIEDGTYTLALATSNGEFDIHGVLGNHFLVDNSPFTISNTTSYPLTLAFYSVSYEPGTYAENTNVGWTRIAAKGRGQYTWNLNPYTRVGYKQIGWSTDQNGTTKTYDVGAVIYPTSATVLYPAWGALRAVSITDGSGVGSTKTSATGSITGSITSGTSAVEGETVTITPGTPANGYKLSAVKYNDGTDHVLTKSDGKYSFTMPAAAVTISTEYVSNTFTVTYNPGTNGTGSQQTATKTEGTALTLKGAIFTRIGYDQTGWANTDGGTKAYELGGSYTTDAAKNFYPVWTAIAYNISYTLNGGTASGNPTSYTIESNAITLSNPTRSGYSFLGWTGSNGTTAQTNVSIPAGSTENKTYIAKWKADKPASAPDASIVTAKTHTSISIRTEDGYEYSVNGTSWYSGAGSYTFIDLEPNTPYNLVCRKPSGSSGGFPYEASDASEALPVSTKTAPAAAPAEPTIGTDENNLTSNSITVSTAEGNEYYISTSPTADWSGTHDGYFKADDNGTHKFDGLSPATKYYIHFRTAETENAMPSASGSVSQYTLPETPAAGVVTINYAAETIDFASTYEVSTSADFDTTIGSGGALQPETIYYVRVKAESGVPASKAVSFLIPERPTTPTAITAANITKTQTAIIIVNTVDGQEYQVNGTWYTPVGGKVEVTGLAAGTKYSIVTRVKATGNTFASLSSAALTVKTKTAPAALSDSGVTYSVKNGTVTGLGSTYEYSLDNGATWKTAPVTGVTFAAGNVIQVRTRETDDAMPSLPQTLGTIGPLAAAPAYDIDFIGEKTSVSVPATVEYNTASTNATVWMAGADAPLMLSPGTTYYFHVAATDAALAGNVQMLESPARPAAPDVSAVTIAAGGDASHTAITLADTYEYIFAGTLPDVSASGTAGTGSAAEVSAIGGQHVYIRVKATVSAFASDWTDCGEVRLGVDDINLTGVGYDVAAGTLTGTTTNMQYSLDGGSIWQDCAAGNTTGLTFIAGAVKVRQKDKVTNEAIVATLAAPAESSAPTLGSKTYNSVTLTAMAGYEYSRDGGATWQDSNIFSGLSSSTEYSFVARSKATAATLPGTISASLTVTTDSAPSGGSTNSGNSPASTTIGAPVIVDGKTVNIGAENKTEDTTTVTVDQSKLGENIDRAAAGSSVVVPVSENGAATASLVVKNIEDMAQKGMTLTVQTGSTAYNLNTSAIDTAALAAAFPGADMSKVPFDVTIQNSSVSVEGETLVLSPVAFTITATYNGKTVSVDTFSAYINRVIEVTAKQAAKITTAVVVNADGSTRHVPTNVIEKDGKYYAIINSRTNSTYALIQNEVTFADASGKWYEAAVNEMGSRKIIGGRSASVFDGGAGITRAEYAAILIRALGLTADGTSSFSDVPTTAWYTGAVATAVQYGLVAGKGENRFDPNANITRQEAMLMLQRVAALTEFRGARGALDGFADVDNIASWAEDAAKWSVGSGLIQGADGRLNPTANITRAESAAIILRLLQKAGLVDVRS